VILTHHRDDLHQDHRVVAELTWNTFLNHTILEYEVPKYDGGLGSPNFFVPLSAELVDAKVAALLRSFLTQRQKSWSTAETFKALMRLRGIECQSESGYAEAFYARKAIWALGAAR
jgi:LmbE family N-acetylglucosaminyl deacetylase